MLNTWGDRSQDAKIDEAFCLAELDRAARMGITLFQLDDAGRAEKALTQRPPEVVLRIFGRIPVTWTPNPTKFPHGLKPIVEKGKKLVFASDYGSTPAYRMILPIGKKMRKPLSDFIRSTASAVSR